MHLLQWHRAEREADRFGLELTHDNEAAATAFVALQQQNLAVPRPGRLFTIFRASHPPIGARVDFIGGQPVESPTAFTATLRRFLEE